MNTAFLDSPVSLEHLADARRARGRPAGVTRPPDLDDPAQYRKIPGVALGDNPPNFVPVRKVPVLDTYEDEGRGAATEAYLELLVRNTNARVAAEEYPVVTIGHFVEDAPEPEQPEIVGYLKNFVVGTYKGRPCILADEFLRVDRYADALTYPRRSVEMWQSRRPEGNYIESIAHLRKAPERPLGLITHAKNEDAGRNLVRFSRAEPKDSAHAAPPTPQRCAANREAFLNFASSRGLTDLDLAESRWRELGGSNPY